MKLKKPRIKVIIILTLLALFIIAGIAWSTGNFYSPTARQQVNPLEDQETDKSTAPATYKPPKPEQFLNTLVLGIDEDGLSDVIILLSVNLQEDLIVITSISRNTYVSDQNWIDPDAGRSHLSYATYSGMGPDNDYHSGAATAAYWVEHLFGVTVHEYVLITYESFVELIDLIGGVEIYVDPAFADVRHRFFGKEMGPLPTGQQRLSGKQAFAYAHFRGDLPGNPTRIPEPGSDSADGDRIRRNQKLLKAIYGQVRTMKLTEILSLINKASEMVHTSISVWDLTTLAPKLYNTKFDQMMTIVIPGESERFPAADRGYGYYEYYYVDFARSDALLEGIGLK